MSEIEKQIKTIEERIEFLNIDKTKWINAWAYPEGYTPYDHGPRVRREEKKKLRAKLKRLKKQL
jgi:hypothetical protein